jgi:large subunit ribosomal protein L20
MARVKNGAVTKARHKKVLKQAKGYFGSKHRLYKTAKEQLMHSGQYAFRDRKQKKRDFRKLWITRINAACRENEISYSRFIEGLNYAGVELNRKMASEIAINDPKAFSEMVKTAKDALNAKKDGKEFTIKHEKVTAKKETKSEEKKETKEETLDYTKLTVTELKKIASEKKIEIPAGAKKTDIIDLLK